MYVCKGTLCMCVCAMNGRCSGIASGMLDFTLQIMGTIPDLQFLPADGAMLLIRYPYPTACAPTHTQTHTYPYTHATFCTLSFQSLDLALKYCNYFFTSTFVLESILKLIAFGFRRFFKDRYSVCFCFVRRQYDCVWKFPCLLAC